LPNIDLVLLGNRGGQNLYDIMASMKAVRPDLRIIVTGSAWMMRVSSKPSLPAQRLRRRSRFTGRVYPGSPRRQSGFGVAPRRVLSTFIERVSAPRAASSRRTHYLYDREKEVLEMLVAGRSNKEIGSALGSKSAP